MARKEGTLNRLKVAWYLAFGNLSRDIRTMNCGCCGSTNIKEIESPKERMSMSASHKTTYIWSDKVKCQNCGAECEEKQTWKW